MIPELSFLHDPGLTALLGALIGAGSSVIVQIVAAVVAARHETRTFRRTVIKETIASVTDAYELVLNVIFNIKRSSSPDSVTYGNVFAQVALRGSPEVKRLVTNFLALTREAQASFDVEALIQVMQQHIAELEREAR